MEQSESLWKQPQKKDEECSALTILKDFCEYTSWGGLERVAGSKYLFFRIIWLFAFLAAFGAGIFQLVGLFQLYQSQPVSTQISLERSTRLVFPAVTICNFNMLRKSRRDKLPSRVQNIVEQFATKRNRSRIAKKILKKLPDDLPDPSDLNEAFIAKEQLIAALSKEDDSVLGPVGHQLDMMVLNCQFKGMDCTNSTETMSHWSSYWHYKYGNCYSFNQKHSKDGKTYSPLQTTRSGPSHGLVLEVDIEQNEYIDQMTENAGIVVHISPPGQMPFPYEEGLSVAPGYSTSIGLRMVNVIRVDRFNNNTCIDRVSQNNENLYATKFGTDYSTMACLESCMALHQKKDCGCMEYKYYPKDEVVCDDFNITTTNCLSKLLVKSRNNQLNCTSACPPPCQEQVFRTTPSFASWPSESYKQSLVEKLKTDKNEPSSSVSRPTSSSVRQPLNQKDQNVIPDEMLQKVTLRKDLLKLEIFFQDLNYEKIQQDISYKIENFVSDIGGQLGLWLGVSVLSGLEVIELIFLLFIYFCNDKPKKKRKRRDRNKNNQHEIVQMTQS